MCHLGACKEFKEDMGVGARWKSDGCVRISVFSFSGDVVAP